MKLKALTSLTFLSIVFVNWHFSQAYLYLDHLNKPYLMDNMNFNLIKFQIVSEIQHFYMPNIQHLFKPNDVESNIAYLSFAPKW